MVNVADILGPGGRVAGRLPTFERRDMQLAMAHAVEEAIWERHHLIVEAGTGVGKSFAYLVPAILAVAADEDGDGHRPRRVVISTHTISLQEQLLEKDLPFLNSVIPLEFTAVLVKGRSNYLSLRRLAAALRRKETTFSTDEQLDQLRDVAAWSRETDDGSTSDLDFKPVGEVWDEVASEHGNCMGRDCPTYGQCFYYRARRRVQHAQLLIVNHALLFSDLALRRAGASMLPDYDVVVFDETHNIEDVASDHLGARISSSQVSYVLRRLYNDRTGRGLLVRAGLHQAQQAVEACRGTARDLFRDIDLWNEQHGRRNGRVDEPAIVPNRLSSQLRGLSAMIGRHGAGMTDREERQDFVAAAARLDALAGELECWLAQDPPDAVYWIETIKGNRPRVTLRAAPLDVGPQLRDLLFNQVPTVVMTSATLAVGRVPSFAFLKARTGLTQAAELQLGSPFDYAQQCELVLVDGMPDPSADAAGYERRVVQLVRRYVERSDGHAFVLFTNYEMLRAVAGQLAGWAAEHNLGWYSQAEGLPRTQMLERFRADPRGVLLGTDSFWQGVDVPGDALRNVIITKLPFAVPDQPLHEARQQAIRARGGNPFIEYQVPQAVLKLKQGFGRLIRRRTDEGMVVVLDSRILRKPYGRTFLGSLPDCRRVIEQADEMAADDEADITAPVERTTGRRAPTPSSDRTAGGERS